MCLANRLKQGSAVETEVFTLRILTPLMMHGWQPVEAAVRIPSIRGVLRYWWRTLQWDLSTDVLLKEEQRLFGGVGGGDQGVRSPVMFRLEHAIYSREEAWVTPHSPSKRFKTKAILEGQTIRLVMSHYIKDLGMQEKHRLYVQYMFLLAGFGQRARRGAGAVQYEGFTWNTLADVQQTLRQLIAQLNREQSFSFPPSDTGHLLQFQSSESPAHPVLNAVWAGRAYSDPELARRAISDAGHQANPSNRIQYLGYTKGQARLASPLHATIRQVGKEYVPIISEVTTEKMHERGYQAARDQFLRLLGVKV